jgi:hypothetical protein
MRESEEFNQFQRGCIDQGNAFHALALWTPQGVLAIALNAALQKRKAKQTITQLTQVDGIVNTNP